MFQLNLGNSFEIAKLNSTQLDAVPLIDLHTCLLAEPSENIPGVIQKLSDNKLKALVDLSSWDKDTFNPVKFGLWLNIIFSMEKHEALRELKRMDHDELVLFLASVLNIIWYNPEEIYDGDYILTIDQSFLLYPKDRDNDSEISKLALYLIDIAYLEGIVLGRKLCLDVISNLYSANEEECFRMKGNRLADEGIPTFIDSLELFYFENPGKLLTKIIKMIGKEKYKKYSPDNDYIISGFTVVPKSFWKESYNLSEEMLDSIQIELSSLLTASIVVNNAVDKDMEHIKGVIERSMSYFKIGLDLLLENCDFEINEILRYILLRHIFRLGFSLLVDLKRNAGNVKVAMDEFRSPAMITHEEEEFVKYLLQPIPLLKISSTQKEEQFESLEQLKRARELLSQLAAKLT